MASLTIRSLAASAVFLLASQAAAQQGLPTLYGEAWGGPVAVLEDSLAVTDPNNFDFVEATLVMPHLAIPKNPRNVSDQYTASYWIGMDGFSSPGINGLWQAGVIMSIWGNGTTTYDGFYEWVPNDPISVNSSTLAISEGDHLHVVLNTTNGGLLASTTLTNLNNSQSFSVTLDAPVSWRGPTWPAQGYSAEWIIEAGTYLNGPQYVLPDWGNATIYGAQGCRNATGECVLAGDAITNLTAVYEADSGMLFSQTGASGDEIWIQYVEEQFTP